MSGRRARATRRQAQRLVKAFGIPVTRRELMGVVRWFSLSPNSVRFDGGRETARASRQRARVKRREAAA